VLGVDRPLQGLDHLAEMLAHGRLAGIRIAAGQRLDDGMTLRPGALIATGTPDGVGFARTPPEFLKPGDLLETEVERIGILRNRMVGAAVAAGR
jgi:Fumarylacetoacetate (FAA) hydrolase family